MAIRNLKAYTLNTAARFYPFLCEDPWTQEDLGQVAELVALLGDPKAVHRELYHLARDLGWRKVNKPGSWDRKVWRRLP
jgi:hypothetical protein